MKKLLVYLIVLYQRTPLHSHYRCRFIPTCSEYMKECILSHGSFRGIFMGIKRILRCHPGGKSGIDMVPKKENRMKKLLIMFLSLFLLTGCFGGESKSNVKTYATLYPIEFATKYMYSDFGDITNIYPSGADVLTYELTEKQKDIYSSGDIFIYAGITNEVNLAVDFLNANSNLKIIDATKGVNYSNGVEELWLDPSNYLMIARNIKSTLKDYEKNIYNQDKIERLYDELKIKISELDVDLTMMGKNASRNTILVTNDVFNFLSKYNINVVSLDPNNQNVTKSYNDARKLISNEDVKYVYVMKGKALSEELESFISNNKLEKLEIDTMYTLSDEQRKNSDDYLKIMNSNITKFKTELFR